MSDTLAPFSIHIYYSNIQSSVLSVALVPDLYIMKEMIVKIAPDQQGCILVTPTSSQDGNKHLQHANLLLTKDFLS